ncbi:hypothetical protein ACJ73_08888 [Blastomyces percursus]|uniref:Uncharacterized protein n=1 Tax=Blastomyces percursus TaxID=1658174 RepID=A0A1J9PIU1_9EURO|nr:hypothetical protein ACJ73_08888 [Blastomyces percursus]
MTYLRQNNDDATQQHHFMANEILTYDNLDANARSSILSAIKHRDTRAKKPTTLPTITPKRRKMQRPKMKMETKMPRLMPPMTKPSQHEK